MSAGKLTGPIVASMLLVDAIAGIVLAVAISPLVGGLAFAFAAGTTLVALRMIRAGLGAGSGAPTATPIEPAGSPAEADPSYNPYARED